MSCLEFFKLVRAFNFVLVLKRLKYFTFSPNLVKVSDLRFRLITPKFVEFFPVSYSINLHWQLDQGQRLNFVARAPLSLLFDLRKTSEKLPKQWKYFMKLSFRRFLDVSVRSFKLCISQGKWNYRINLHFITHFIMIFAHSLLSCLSYSNNIAFKSTYIHACFYFINRRLSLFHCPVFHHDKMEF